MSTTSLILLIIPSFALTFWLAVRIRRAHEAMMVLRKELITMQREYLELQADFERVKNDEPERDRSTRGELFKQLLPIDDHVQRALAHAKSDPKNLAMGLEILAKDLNQTWSSLGVERLALKAGDPFEPAHHEAIACRDPETAQPCEPPIGSSDADAAADTKDAPLMSTKNSVLEIMSDGFCYEGRVLRPAKVVVLRALPEARDGE